MKKLLFLIFTGVCLRGNAQDTEFGIVCSSNSSRIKTQGMGNTSVSSFMHGGMAGWYARFHVSKKWAIQPELLEARYGGKINDSVFVRLNYIVLPVLGRLELTPKCKIKIIALTGPQLGVLVSGIKEYGDKKEDYQRVYFSWLFGAGYAFRKYGLDVSLRYNLGLSDIHASDNIKASMNAFQIVVSCDLIKRPSKKLQWPSFLVF